jgi:hypothetical protein
MKLTLSSSGTQVVVIGTGRHDPGSVLPDVPAVAATVRDLATGFVERCGVPAGNVEQVLDPPEPR